MLFISLCFSFSSVFKSKNPTVPVETPNLNYMLQYFSPSRPFNLPIWFLSIKLSLSVKTSEYISLPASYKRFSQDSQTPPLSHVSILPVLQTLAPSEPFQNTLHLPLPHTHTHTCLMNTHKLIVVMEQ